MDRVAGARKAPDLEKLPPSPISTFELLLGLYAPLRARIVVGDADPTSGSIDTSLVLAKSPAAAVGASPYSSN